MRTLASTRANIVPSIEMALHNAQRLKLSPHLQANLVIEAIDRSGHKIVKDGSYRRRIEKQHTKETTE